jgi:signal transduction histidine kinase
MQDIFCMIFGGAASVSNLNLSLFLAYATLYPNAHFLLFYVIPVKAWIFAVFDLAIILYQVITLTSWGLFPFSLYPLVALLNYFLFFGKDVVNVIPVSWRANFRRLLRKKQKKTQSAKTVPFPSAGSYQATVAKVKAPYTHQCTICGKTDISNPELEFRYCSRCNGYHCYCQEHISNHSHIQ